MSTPRTIADDTLGNAIADATYTEFDQTQAQAYVDNRTLLFQLWDLATTYPCIASKIEIRIRQADSDNDYMYEESTRLSSRHCADSTPWTFVVFCNVTIRFITLVKVSIVVPWTNLESFHQVTTRS